VGLSIAALAAATSLSDTDVFEIEQPGLSVKLTRAQLAALLLPAPALHSGLTAADTLADADLFVVEQSGVIMKLTKLELVTLLDLDFITVDQSITRQQGDIISYDGANYVTGETPLWQVVHQDAYTEAAVASSSTITFAGGGPTDGIKLKGGEYFAVGSPVRVVMAARTIYGICTAVTDTLLTISGASLTLATAIISLSVGSRSMLRHVQLKFSAVTYNTATGTDLAKNCRTTWKGPTGHLVACSASHMNTSATTIININLQNGGFSLTPGLTVAAGTATTHGAFVDAASGTFNISDFVKAVDGMNVMVRATTLGGSADFLIVCLTFVVP